MYIIRKKLINRKIIKLLNRIPDVNDHIVAPHELNLIFYPDVAI